MNAHGKPLAKNFVIQCLFGGFIKRFNKDSAGGHGRLVNRRVRVGKDSGKDGFFGI